MGAVFGVGWWLPNAASSAPFQLPRFCHRWDADLFLLVFWWFLTSFFLVHFPLMLHVPAGTSWHVIPSISVFDVTLVFAFLAPFPKMFLAKCCFVFRFFFETLWLLWDPLFIIWTCSWCRWNLYVSR